MTARRQLRSDGAFDLRFGGGINERDKFNISIQECVEGWNFLLDATGGVLHPRLPQDLEGTAPNAGEITGILQLIESDDTTTQLLVANDTWYDWDGASIYSDVTPPLFAAGASGARMRGTHWTLDDFLIITDLDAENVLYKWNGSTVTRLKTTLVAGSPQTFLAGNLTCSGSTATSILSTHGFTTGDLVTIAGANETEYNGEKQITVSDVDTFTFTIVCSTTPATGTITADKGIELKAKYAVNHNSRSWLFNITADGTTTPSMILVSAFENAEDYDNATRGETQGGTGLAASDAFFLLAPDGRPINGAVEFFNTLIISTVEGKLFRLTGSDALDYAFVEFYPGSSSIGDEGFVNTGDDIAYFRKGRAVESVTSTERFGDISTDDLSFWIPTSAKLMSNPIAVYDQEEQKIYFFDSGLGGVLVLDKEFLGFGKSDDSGRLSPWSLYKTLMSNGFVTKCAVAIRDPLATDKTKTVFWGDSSGNVYNMNGTVGGGDGGSAAVSMRRKTRIIDSLDTQNELMLGRLEYERNAAVNVELVFNWSDEYHRELVSFDLKDSFGLGDAIFWGGDIYWNETDNYWSASAVADDQVSTLGFSTPGKGSAFFLEIQISNVNDYSISRLYV